MTLPAIIAFLGLAVICVAVARRMANDRGRSRRAWMVSAVLLGPLPLAILAVLPVRKCGQAG